MIFLKTAMLNIRYDYKIILLEQGLNFKKLGYPREIIFYLYRIYNYYILYLWFHEADYIIPIVAQMSDVAHGPIVS